jgi:hypothetical protein
MLEHNPGVISPHQNMEISDLFHQNTTRVYTSLIYRRRHVSILANHPQVDSSHTDTANSVSAYIMGYHTV